MKRWRLAALLLGIIGVAWVALWQYRPGPPEPPPRQAAVSEPAPDELTATWLGVSAVLLRQGEHAVLIDPFFTRPAGMLPMIFNRSIQPDEALIRRWLDKLGLYRLDAVLVSHSHFDHAMDAGVVARLTGARLIGSPSTLNIGRGADVHPGQLQLALPRTPIQAGPFRITFHESQHAGATGGRPRGDIGEPLRPPARYLDYRLGGTYSILIEHPQGRVLHHGSAGFEPGMLQSVRADVVFLGVALIDDLETYLQETVDAVVARVVVPVHWDDFTRPLDQPLQTFPFVVRLGAFFDHMVQTRPEVQVVNLGLGEAVDLFPGH